MRSRCLWGWPAKLVALAVGVGLLAGCQSLGLSSFGNTEAALLNQSPAVYYSADDALANGKAYFNEKAYGKAQVAYQRAVELEPQNGEALLGLAACYDRLRRFDLADAVYREAARVVGSRPEYYNNLGYSYMLRGQLQLARQNFLKANELDPGNPVIQNNLALLMGSADLPARN